MVLGGSTRKEKLLGGRRNEGFDRGEPVEPGEARASGNDPDAVEVHRRGESGYTGGRSQGRSRSESLGPDIHTSSGTSGTTGTRRVSGSSGGGYDDDGPDLEPARRDSVRWGPIWAGLITALTVFLLLQLLAIGLGLVGIGPGQGGGGWVPAIIGLIAFFTGGAVAGMTSAIRGVGTGLLNGFLVFALGTVLILTLSAFGLGQLFGALGNVAGQVNPSQVANAAQNAQQNAPNVSAQEAASALRTGSIGAFFGLLFAALASMLGGILGGRGSDPLGRPSEGRAER